MCPFVAIPAKALKVVSLVVPLVPIPVVYQGGRFHPSCVLTVVTQRVCIHVGSPDTLPGDTIALCMAGALLLCVTPAIRLLAGLVQVGVVYTVACSVHSYTWAA